MNKHRKFVVHILIVMIIVTVLTPLTMYARQEMVSDGGGSVTRKYYDYNIINPSLMPKIEGCSDDFDGELYWAGIASGIDPAFLKTIMKAESSGRADIPDNHNTNGTFDIGIMQINSGGLGGTVLPELTKADIDQLRTNHMLNIWASTQTLKEKARVMRTREGEKFVGRKVGMDAFSLFWHYNGVSEQGYGYASTKTHPIYMKATRLRPTARLTGDAGNSNLYAMFTEKLYAAEQTIALVDLMTNENRMTFDEFSDQVEKLSGGDITVNRSGVSDNMKKGYYNYELEGSLDNSTGTGLQQELTEVDIVINYKVYRFVKGIVKIINLVIVGLSYVAMLVLVATWSMFAIALAGFVPFAILLDKLTNGKVNTLEEGSAMELIKLSVIVLTIIAFVLTGTLQILIEKAIIGFLGVAFKTL